MHGGYLVPKLTVVDAPSTTQFKRCRGVFEGGGSRAIAHIGAYEAAVQCGVELVQVAGTSAGAAIAALIGAGATPQYLLEHLKKLPLASLLEPPEGMFKTPFRRPLARMLLPFLSGHLSTIGTAYFLGGRYSSRGLQSWIDARLFELLPTAQRPIRFSDLLLPTWVVAADLSAGRPKIWSSSTTPGTSVSFAVRCSCSLPLVFEPVAEGTTLYADGGILSNIPAFVFFQNDGDGTLNEEPILAFCLTDDAVPVRDWSPISLCKQLLNTSVSGSWDIQSSLQPDVSAIGIPTHGVRATDFELSEKQKTDLCESGRKAVFGFFGDEARQVRGGHAKKTHVWTEDELYDALVREASDPGTELVVSCRSTKWYWDLFPTFAAWRREGAQVRVILPPISGTSEFALKEMQRRTNLSRLGAHLCDTPSIAHEVFVLCRNDRSQQSAFVLRGSDSTLGPFATVYAGPTHTVAVSSIRQSVLSGSGNQPVPSLRLAKADAGPIIRALKRGVRQYSGGNVRIRLERVPTEATQLMVHRIRRYKSKQVHALRKLYEHGEVPLFGPAELTCDGRGTSIVTPPVLEVWNDQLIVIEGNTRFSYAWRNSVPEVTALVVRGVEDPLPGRPVPIGSVGFASFHDGTKDRIQGFTYDRFRKIERAVRPLIPD